MCVLCDLFYCDAFLLLLFGWYYEAISCTVSFISGRLLLPVFFSNLLDNNQSEPILTNFGDKFNFGCDAALFVPLQFLLWKFSTCCFYSRSLDTVKSSIQDLIWTEHLDIPWLLLFMRLCVYLLIVVLNGLRGFSAVADIDHHFLNQKFGFTPHVWAILVRSTQVEISSSSNVSVLRTITIGQLAFAFPILWEKECYTVWYCFDKLSHFELTLKNEAHRRRSFPPS